MKMPYYQHPLSAAFPAMEDDTFKALVEDIRQHGQRDIATLYEGMVVDGWHRYRACEELDIPCRFEKYEGDDALSFVKSKNQHRRHYEKTQRAAIVISLNAWATAGNQSKGEATSPLATNREMAAEAGTTVRTIQQAKRAHEAGLNESMRDGKISAERAAELAKKAPEAVKQVVSGEITIKQAVAQVKAKKPVEVPVATREEPSEPVQSDLEMLRDHIAELTATAKELLEENNSMGAVMDADDKLAALSAENKKIRELNRVLNERIQGLQGECNEAKRAAKMWRAKHDKLEKKAF